MTLLSIDDLSVSYGGKPAVHGISLRVEPGEMTAIVGESGSGKTTTAMSALGLNSANAHIDSGRITFDGQDVTHLTHKQWRTLRGARVGLIPQDPNNSLNPLKTIGHSIEEGLRIHGRTDNLRAHALTWLERVGIDDPERRYNQYPHELSGGMKQRVLIASALALEPDLIVADEPTSALDVTVQKTILDLLDAMRRELGLGILFITHDLSVAGDRANRIVVMEKGEVREEGLAARVFSDPQHPYSRRLLADAPSLAVGSPRARETAHTAASEALVQVRDLTRTFGDFTAVDGVSFDVARGSTHAIVGESGSGKTTTGRIISMFEQASSGSVTVGGHEITAKHSKAELKELRRGIQLIYQNPYSSLNPRMPIGDIVAEPLRNFAGASKASARAKAREFLDLVALDPQMASRRPRELSGGQRQRIAIARAMIVEPELVILDEAVSALDVTVQAQILRLLDKLQRDLDLTYIFISHDLAVVSQISDTVSVLRHGQQLESGTTHEVFAHPQSPFTRELIDAIPGQHYRAGDLNLGL